MAKGGYSIHLTAVAVLAAVVMSMFTASAQAEETTPHDLRILTSVPPLYFLIAAVTTGAHEPELLIPSGASPHNYALRPSGMRKLAAADLVFWIGPMLETPLARPLKQGAFKGRIIEFSDLTNLHHLHQRRQAVPAKVAAAGAAMADPHLWLNPANAAAIVDVAVRELSARDPAHAALFQRNGAQAKERLAQLDRMLHDRLSPLADLPFLTFHDAYQYLEARYGLRNLGFVVQDPEHPSAGARHLANLRDRASRYNARCVFIEPEYDPHLVQPVIEGTPARIAILDHMGARLPLEGESYYRLMESLARDITACLTFRAD